jgi:hypothetical protein
LYAEITLADGANPSSVYAMWNILWHMRGSVPVDGSIADELLLERVVRLLEGQQKPITGRTADSVRFSSPRTWRIVPNNNNLSWGWSAMRDFDRGVFWIARAPEGRMLRYELRRLHLFLLILTTALFFFIVITLRGYPLFAAAFGIFSVLWLYVPSVLLARLRIPRKIRAAVKYGY